MAGATLPLTTDPFAGRTLGKYEVLCRLSMGGMSEIFLAYQKGLAGFTKMVVLKSILPDIRGEEEFVRMFLDEAKITASFTHPNIAQVYDLDIDQGELFLAMEFVPGCTLVEVARACRANNEAIPTGFTLQAVRDTALALHYAHNFTDPLGRKQVVIHRDVAEKNIMVTYEGTTKLLDFGIAKSLNRTGRTTIGMVKGTSGYMSPEQILGETLDARSDLFSLGVVLHECLTGMRLFHGKKPEDGMMAALKEDVAPPSLQNPEVSAELDAVVLKALRRDRADRFATALEFARAIEKACGDQIWHPEQSGELVQRLFKERREQTRELLGQARQKSGEVTGEIPLASLLNNPSTGGRGTAPPPLEPARRTGVTMPLPRASKAALPTTGLSADKEVTHPPMGPTTRMKGRLNSSSPLPDPADTKPRRRMSRDGLPLMPPPVSSEPDADTGSTALPDDFFRDLERPEVRAGSVAPSLAMRAPSRNELDEVTGDTQIVPPDRLGLMIAEPSAGGGLPTIAMYGDTHPGAPNPTLHPAPKVRGKLLIGALFALVVFVLGVGVLQFSTKEREPDPSVSAPLPPTSPVNVSPTPVRAPVEPKPEVKPPEPKAPPDAKTVPVDTAPTPPPTKTVAPPSRPAGPAAPVPPVATRKKAETVEASESEEAKKAPASGPGQLTLVTDPPARATFKAQDLGTTPLLKVNLPSGKHTLRLTAPDQGPRLLTVEIKEGQITAVRVPLVDLPSE